MLVMVSNHTSWRTHYLQGRYGGLGLLLPPGGVKGPWPHLPYALDNGAFPAWKNSEAWDEEAFIRLLEWASSQELAPRWVVVPDVVTNPGATIDLWRHWSPLLRERGFTVALAVQDGMTPKTVEGAQLEPEIIFVGGSTDFKWGTLPLWVAAFPHVHVGRVNGLRGLMRCHELGVESCDGTGFFRGRRGQLEELVMYLKEFRAPDLDSTEQAMFLPLNDGHPQLPFAEKA